VEKITLIKLKNPFIRTDRDIELIDFTNKTLTDIRNSNFPQDVDVVISINGQIIQKEQWDIVKPKHGDYIVMSPVLHGGGGGGGGKNVLRTIAFIAVAVISAVLAPELVPSILIKGTFGYNLAVGLIAAGMMTVGGLIVNALLPPPKPKINTADSIDFDKSMQYSWNPQTTQQQGIPVPKVYGTMKVTGNIISAFIENINDQQYLNMLICLGLGPVSNIYDITINDQPSEYFSGVSIETRLGYLNQTVISHFNDTKTEYDMAVKVSSASSYTYLTVGNNFNALEMDITFSNGLWYANDRGGLDPYSVSFKIETRKQGTSEWTTIAETTITEAKNKSIRRTFKYDVGSAGKYEIRVTKLTADRNDVRYGDDMYLTAVREVYLDDFEYPRHALVGIKALASDQISGSIRFSCMVDGSLIRVYDGTQWKVEFNNNPAWVVWDILTQPVFDNDLNIIRYDGIDPSRLDLLKFKEWADFCDELVPDGRGGYEKRITFNGIFDSETSMWEAIMEVCQVGRAMLVWNGVNLTVSIDKPSQPVQLFSVGNIGLDSFKETFVSIDERATEIEIDFVNSENNYERDRFSIVNRFADTKSSKSSLQLMGITKPSEAWRAGMYRLLCNQYLTRTIEFEADIDSIACTIGDVVYVQHDVPQWEYGGRIVSATTTTVTVDRKIYIDISKSYKILIRLANDTIVERSIVNPEQNGEYDTFTVLTAFTEIPQQFDVYTFGEVSKVAKPFRITAISRTHEQKATITAVEYNENIYSVDTMQPILPTYDYSALEIYPSVTNLSLKELPIRNSDGSLMNVIDVYFTKPDSGSYAYCEVWYSSGSSFIFAGNSYSDTFRITNVEVNKLYTVAVVTVNKFGNLYYRQPLSEAPTASIYVLGKAAPPSDVTEFRAWQNGQFVNFRWNHIEDADLYGYEIRLGTDWNSARVIATAISQNTYSWQAELNGTYRFLIKAIDDSGNYSLNPASFDITLKGIDEKLNVILSQDEMTKENPADGIKTNFDYIPSYHSLMMPHALTDTDVSAWTDQTSDITNYDGSITLEAEYVTNAIDTYKNTETYIRIQEAISNIDNYITDLSYPDRTDLSYPNDTDQSITAPFIVNFYYSISSDGLTYSNWKSYHGTVQEEFRYIKFKVYVKVFSTTTRFKLQNLLLLFDVPDVELKITNFSVSSSGADVNFANYDIVFYTVPNVTATLLSDTVNKVPVISNKSTTGFHIDLLNTSNQKVSGTVDITVKGY